MEKPKLVKPETKERIPMPKMAQMNDDTGAKILQVRKSINTISNLKSLVIGLILLSVIGVIVYVALFWGNLDNTTNLIFVTYAILSFVFLIVVYGIFKAAEDHLKWHQYEWEETCEYRKQILESVKSLEQMIHQDFVANETTQN